MTDSVGKIADAVARAEDSGATLRIAQVTGLSGTKVRLDITGTAWVAVDADVVGLAVGQRVYAMQQGPITVVSGRLTGTPPAAVPVGALSLYAGTGTAMPAGYLLANGASLLRSEWPDLFAVIGTTYGAADASRFSLPNLVDRVPLGAGNRGRGATGGAERVMLSTTEMPSHNHGGAGSHQHAGVGDHSHFDSNVGDAPAVTPGTTNGYAAWFDGQTGGGGGHQHAGVGDHTHANNGGGSTHENMQPWVALFYMIRAS